MTPGSAVRTSLPGEVRLAVLPPLAVYAHFPWCVRKCPYCDFNSHERRGDLPEDAYVKALIADLEELLPAVWGRRAISVFLGGGTPSLFAPRSIERLLSALRARIPLAPDAEITLEANPGTVEAQRFAGFRAAGINRLSLGVQSFDEQMLATLGRIHSADNARLAIETASRYFGNVNIDLMYGLPGQTLAVSRRDVEEAVRWGATHVSAYQLTIEPNTVFYRERPRLPEHDLRADMQLAVEETLAAAGYEHYETSAFARPGRRARHNLNYWQFGDYLGLGAGAHGKLSFSDSVTRHARVTQPQEYLKAIQGGSAKRGSLLEKRLVRARELPFEFMLNALRLIEGFPAALFHERTGLPLRAVDGALVQAEHKGLIERDLWRIRPTERGRQFLNELLILFLPA